jgi:lantibiotic modifying enzyme
MRVAELGGDEALLSAAGGRLEREAPTRFGAADDFDLVSGRSGAILSLCAAHDVTAEHALLEAAVRLGRELMGQAVEDDGAASWPTAERFRFPTVRPLTGLAHGTSGVALALLSLATKVGDDSPRALAQRALAYESRVFDPSARKWPDYRAFTGVESYVPTFTRAWCHGAPGIGVARARALELGAPPSETLLRDLRAALDTTLAALRIAHQDPDADPCLCHGTAGLLLAAHTMASALGDAPAAEEVLGVAQAMARSILDEDPAGAAMVDPLDATLMTGSAGVGYALLRVAGLAPPFPLLAM